MVSLRGRVEHLEKSMIIDEEDLRVVVVQRDGTCRVNGQVFLSLEEAREHREREGKDNSTWLVIDKFRTSNRWTEARNDQADTAIGANRDLIDAHNLF